MVLSPICDEALPHSSLKLYIAGIAVEVPACISLHTPQHLGLFMQFIYEPAGTHNVDRHLLQSGEINNLLAASYSLSVQLSV